MSDKITLMQAERLINPPRVIRDGETVLSPPLDSVEAYMRYMRENREAYRQLFGAADGP